MSNYPTADDIDFEDIQVGMEFSAEHAFSEADVWRFAELSGDYSPLHVDPDYAAGTEFGRCVVHGILLASLFSQVVGMRIPGKRALYLGQDLTFRRSVLVGESFRVLAKVTAKTAATRSLILATEIRTSDGKVAVSGTAKVKVRDSARAAATVPALAAAPAQAAHAQVAVITGGTGGIGAGIARALARRGIAVALLYQSNQTRADRVVSGLLEEGGNALAIQADVGDPGQVQAAFERVAREMGGPTLLVNAVTAPIGLRPAMDLDRSDFQHHLDIQVHAALDVARAAHPFMKKAGGGSIVNIASQVTADAPPAKMADYVTAKYALVGLSKALAVEWAEDNIRVNMVSPGLLQTELTQHYHDRVFKMEASRTPLKRLATPEDVASAAVFLLGEEAGFVTGVNLSVTGGQTML